VIADRLDLAGAVDVSRGLVSRRIFSDPDIYRAEQERIFGRCWLFVAHETQIAQPGDYITCKMGETPVIVVRDSNDAVRVLINSCRHRGNPVTRADAGRARTFTCPYHGWCYDLQGKRVETGSLVGLPGLKSYYDETLELDAWGLVSVAQVATYRGLIFATFDPQAPPLVEYLAEFRWFLDLFFDRADYAAVPGVVRWRMKCNWKFAADNAIGDNSHAQIAHRSAFFAMEQKLNAPRRTVGEQIPGFTLLSEYGHGANCMNGLPPDQINVPTKMSDPVFDHWRTDPERVARQGLFRARVVRYNANLFPNLFIIDQLLMMRNPIGPGETEIRAIALYDRNAPPEVAEAQRRRSFQKFGPSGLLEQEDGENWDQATAGTRIAQTRDADLNYEMGIGSGTFVNDGQSPPRIDSMINEHGQRWFYGFWSDAMQAQDWNDLRDRHARPIGTF
jgi:nitrite reductase/ring-hydroxylating ferredoxin subunit